MEKMDSVFDRAKIIQEHMINNSNSDQKRIPRLMKQVNQLPQERTSLTGEGSSPSPLLYVIL